MGQGGYKIRDKEGIHFVTFAVTEWVDVFTRNPSGAGLPTCCHSSLI